MPKSDTISQAALTRPRDGVPDRRVAPVQYEMYPTFAPTTLVHYLTSLTSDTVCDKSDVVILSRLVTQLAVYRLILRSDSWPLQTSLISISYSVIDASTVYV